MRISDWSSDVCSSDLVEPEAAEVVREIHGASLRQPRHGRAQQAHVLALDVKVVGTGGVGERRRVAEDQVVAAAVGFQPGHRVGLHQAVGFAADRAPVDGVLAQVVRRSEEHTSELQSLMRISYAVFCLKKKRETVPKLYATTDETT